MITVTDDNNYMGLSTDEKPTGAQVTNGACFYEMDTQTAYMYDAENQTWIDQ